MNTARVVAVALVASGIGWPPVASSQTGHAPPDAAAGRALALQACTGCHIVLPQQPFKPVFTGSPHPPDFKDIANEPDLTASSLERHLKSLPAVPQGPSMANPDLTSQELADVIAFILTLRNGAVAPGR